jgi:hypothetical protein
VERSRRGRRVVRRGAIFICVVWPFPNRKQNENLAQ